MSDGVPDQLDAELLLRAYAQGAFPMAEPDTGEIYWYHPDPRAILPLDRMHISRSLRKRVKQQPFEIRHNTSFRQVMTECAKPRKHEAESWIDQRFIDAYTDLHEMGFAQCVEAWENDELVGGVYGVSINGLFAGESMFSRRTDASKVCLVHLVEHLNQRGYQLLDVQFQNDHIAQFGVIQIPRDQYVQQLSDALNAQVSWQDSCTDTL
jgi:leucyl/phenylalanyl-tRNA--protein transferase